MSITAANLVARISVDGAESATAKLLGVGDASESAGLKLSHLAIGATVIAGAALVGLGVLAVKMAADFQQSMTLLVTSAGESQSNLKMVGDGILQMSVQTATSSDKLATAMFNIESAGYRGAAGLAVLKAAAEGAKIENADLDQVTQALTTTMHDWREPASQAVDVMNSFREAASIGTMRMDDFVGAMKNVGPVASLAKIPLTDVEAALSTMSLEGDKGAAAGTHLAQSLLNMIAPTSKAQGVLKEIGLTAQQVSDDMQKSLPDTLKMITEDIGKKFPEGSQKYNAAMSAMFGGTRGLKAILELTGPNLKDFQKDAADLAPIMKQNATNVEGWANVQQNFNFKMDAAKNAVSALFIQIGTYLLPVVGKLVDQIAPLVGTLGKLGDQFVQLVTPIQNTAKAIQPIVEYGKPLFDTFDRASGVIEATTRAAKPLVDTFDRAKSTIKDTTQVAKPFLDTFDRASGIIQSTTQAGNQFGPTLQNIYQGMKNVAQAAGDTVKFIQEMASNVQIAAPILAGLASIVSVIVVPALISFAGELIAVSWPFAALGLAVAGLVYLFQQFHPEITTIQGTFQGLAPIIQNTAAALTVFFLPAMIKSGTEAVISAAKITYNYITSLVATGFAGWSAAFKLAAYVGALIASGAQAVISAAKITFSFIVSLWASASAAYASAYAVTGSFVPALLLLGSQALVAAGKLLVGLVPALAASDTALYATGVAATAALGPLGILIGIVGLAGLAFIAMKNKSDEMQLGTTGSFDTMGNKIQRSTGRIIATADQMKNGVMTAAEQMAYDAANSSQQMDKNVTDAANTMARNALTSMGDIKIKGGQSFDDLLKQVNIDMSQIDTNATQYWADVMGYIENHPINGHITYTTAGGDIGVQQSATTAHNALGTDYWQGGPTWIGERGPEILNLPRGSQIIPNNRIGSAASSGQPVQININLAGHRVAQTLLPDIVQAIRAHTGVKF